MSVMRERLVKRKKNPVSGVQQDRNREKTTTAEDMGAEAVFFADCFAQRL